MDCFHAIALVVLTSFIAQDVTAQVTDITLSPDCTSPSPYCSTLSQFILPSTSKLSITLLPGTHRINSTILIENRATLSVTGTPGETILDCTGLSSRSFALRLRQITNIGIKNVMLIGCKVQITASNNTEISQSTFRNCRTGALEVDRSSNFTITRSNFHNNSAGVYGSVLEVDHSSNFTITRSNFHNNSASVYGSVLGVDSSSNFTITRSNFHNNSASVYGSVLEVDHSSNFTITRTNFTDNKKSSSYAAIVRADGSAGYVSCCNFRNNSQGYYSAIIRSESESELFVTNSSFIGNKVLAYSGIISADSSTASVAIISSVFQFNEVGGYGGVILTETISTVLASDFSNNRAGRNGGTIKSTSNNHLIIIDCTHFFNNSESDNLAIAMERRDLLSIRNTNTCLQIYANGENGICTTNDCEVCRPPDVPVSIAFSEYSVQEDVRNENFALQVCLFATNVPFPVHVVLQVLNGTAEDGEDFLSLSSECQGIDFTLSEGTQTRCSYIEILDDDVPEANEQFMVRLFSSNPQVTFINGVSEATVTIIDDDGDELTSTAGTEMPTVAGGRNKTVLVECGVFSRLVNFADGGNDVVLLLEAITRNFRGLQRTVIALLKIKSEKYSGHFVDILSANMTIQDNSIIKVVPFSKNEDICSV